MLRFEVEGMTCGGCARSVLNAVKRVDPAATVTVDLPSRRVDVATSAPSERVRGAIEAAGYRVAAAAA